MSATHPIGLREGLAAVARLACAVPALVAVPGLPRRKRAAAITPELPAAPAPQHV